MTKRSTTVQKWRVRVTFFNKEDAVIDNFDTQEDAFNVSRQIARDISTGHRAYSEATNRTMDDDSIFPVMVGLAVQKIIYWKVERYQQRQTPID